MSSETESMEVEETSEAETSKAPGTEADINTAQDQNSDMDVDAQKTSQPELVKPEDDVEKDAGDNVSSQDGEDQCLASSEPEAEPTASQDPEPEPEQDPETNKENPRADDDEDSKPESEQEITSKDSAKQEDEQKPSDSTEPAKEEVSSSQDTGDKVEESKENVKELNGESSAESQKENSAAKDETSGESAAIDAVQEQGAPSPENGADPDEPMPSPGNVEHEPDNAAAEEEAQASDGKDDQAETSDKKGFEISDEIYEFPNTLEGFGYKFNEYGQLRSIEKDEPFLFQVKKSINYNQQHYEALGELITEYIFERLEKDLQMERVIIPTDVQTDEPRTFFFMSPGAWEKERLLVLLHGNGVVRAGQWTRKLIINEDIDTGSQLPYIRWGIQNDYGVIVLNPNDNVVNGTKPDNVRKIRGSESPEKHTEYVWDTFLEPSKARYMVFVGHSYGGVCIAHLANKKDKKFRQRVFAMVFTDSVHSLELQQSTKNVKRHFQITGRNWVSSDEDLDTELPGYLTLEGNPRIDALRVSAGTKQHERTSHTARESVFKFIQERFDENRSKPYSDDKFGCISM